MRAAIFPYYPVINTGVLYYQQTVLIKTDIILPEPVGELSEARRSVGEDAMTQSPIFANETDVEL